MIAFLAQPYLMHLSVVRSLLSSEKYVTTSNMNVRAALIAPVLLGMEKHKEAEEFCVLATKEIGEWRCVEATAQPAAT